jgi:hypothetical protein
MNVHTRPDLRSALLIAGLAIAGADCGDDTAPLPQTANYAAAWQEALPPTINEIGLAPEELRWHDGALYYATWDVPRAIVALPVGPGVAPAPRVLLDNPGAFRLWVEGEQVLYAEFDALKAIPIAGGTPVTVLSRPDAGCSASNELLQAPNYDLDADNYYYDTWCDAPNSVTWDAWRLPRAGNALQKLAELTTLQTDSLSKFDHGPTGILTAADWGPAWFVPDDGSGVRELHETGQMLMGLDGSNVLWQRLGAGTTLGHEVFEVWRETPDAPDPTLLWAPPPNIAPAKGFPDGAGGWLFGAIEYFSDHLIHTSVWHLDAAGNATRIAANPEAREELISSMVVAPDAVYAGLSVFSPVTEWTILRLPALDAAPVSSAASALVSAPPPATAAPFALATTLARRMPLQRRALR